MHFFRLLEHEAKRTGLVLATEILFILISQSSLLVDAACKAFCNTPSPWIPVTSNICYGAKLQDFATFSFNQNCNLYALRLNHISGALTDWRNGGGDYWSRWGHRKNHKNIKTIIIEPKQDQLKLWYPEGMY